VIGPNHTTPPDCGSAKAMLLTPPGRAALAVVGIAGRGAITLVDRLFISRGGRRVADRTAGAIAYGTWRSTGENVVVVRHADDRVEVHGHGGRAAPAAVLEDLEAAGAKRCGWEGWPAASRCAREAINALSQAIGPRPAMILTRQAAGAMDRGLEELERLVDRGERAAARRFGTRLLLASRVGLRLVNPWRVALTGQVNAGKSSLLNAILGHARSLVAPLPGTTRDVLTATAVLGGWTVELVDTAGTRPDGRAESPLEQAGIDRAVEVQGRADLIVRVVGPDTSWLPRWDPSDRELVVRSKVDLASDVGPRPAIATSAVTGEGIDELITTIVDRLVPESRRDPPLLAGPVPFTERQVVEIKRLLRAAS